MRKVIVPMENQLRAMQTQQVLVVEDDPALRALFRTLLEKNGFSVACAENGRLALEQLQQADFKAIVLDLMMPELSGFDVLRIVSERRPSLLSQTIVTTGVSEKRLRDLDGVGIYSLIRKPFDIQELVSTVKRCAAQPNHGDGGGEAAEKTGDDAIGHVVYSVKQRFARQAHSLRRLLRGPVSSPDELLLRSELRETIVRLRQRLERLSANDPDPTRAAELRRFATVAATLIRRRFPHGDRSRSH